MNTFKHIFRHTALIIILSIACITTAQAQQIGYGSANTIVGELKIISQKIDAALKSIIHNFINPDFDTQLPHANTAHKNVDKTNTATETNLNTFSFDKVLNVLKGKALDKDALKKYDFPASDDYTTGGYHNIYDTREPNRQKKAEIANNDHYFDIQSLLAPTQYSLESSINSNIGSGMDRATHFLNFVNLFAAPPVGLDLTEMPKFGLAPWQAKLLVAGQLKTLPSAEGILINYPVYKLAYRKATAERSIALAPFYKAYQERVRQPGQSMSALEADKREAFRRFQKDYFGTMQSEAPKNISLETLVVLSEIRKEMYELRRSNEERNLLLAQQLLMGAVSQSTAGANGQAVQMLQQIMQYLQNNPNKDHPYWKGPKPKTPTYKAPVQ